MGKSGSAPKDSPRPQPSHGKKVVVQAILPEICRPELTEEAYNTRLLQEVASCYDRWPSLTAAALQIRDKLADKYNLNKQEYNYQELTRKTVKSLSDHAQICCDVCTNLFRLF